MTDIPDDTVRHHGPGSEYDFEARGIRKTYDGKQHLEILKHIDFSIRKGEMIAVVGASGTGKTTLLHILGTLDRPTAGTLLYRGQNVFNKNDAQLSAFRNKTIGFVFQFHHLLPEFSALENVMLPGLIAALNGETLEQDAVQLLEKVGLVERLHHKVGELSGGEQQRVAIARALIMKPALLLADEPTGNLDPRTGFRVFDLIQEINATMSLSTVMVTHNYELAHRLDRCLTLADGRLSEEMPIKTR